MAKRKKKWNKEEQIKRDRKVFQAVKEYLDTTLHYAIIVNEEFQHAQHPTYPIDTFLIWEIVIVLLRQLNIIELRAGIKYDRDVLLGYNVDPKNLMSMLCCGFLNRDLKRAARWFFQLIEQLGIDNHTIEPWKEIEKITPDLIDGWEQATHLFHNGIEKSIDEDIPLLLRTYLEEEEVAIFVKELKAFEGKYVLKKLTNHKHNQVQDFKKDAGINDSMKEKDHRGDIQMETIDDEALLSPARIAEFSGLPQEPLRKQLERLRKEDHTCFIENTERGSKEAKYLYKFGHIRPIIEKMKAKMSSEMSSERPA